MNRLTMLVAAVPSLLLMGVLAAQGVSPNRAGQAAGVCLGLLLFGPKLVVEVVRKMSKAKADRTEP